MDLGELPAFTVLGICLGLALEARRSSLGHRTRAARGRPASPGGDEGNLRVRVSVITLPITKRRPLAVWLPILPPI